MQAHYLSWRSQNESIEECRKLVLNAVIQEVWKAVYYGIVGDGTPDAAHTEQITFFCNMLIKIKTMYGKFKNAF